MDPIHCVCGLQNSERLDSEIIYDRDFDYDYFGFKVSLNNCHVAQETLRIDSSLPAMD